MRVLVDTNIFIDILLNREPFSADAISIYKLCEQGLIEGYIAPITINNIYYICRKAKELESIKAYLADISRFFIIAPMNSESIKKANKLKMYDYEDSLQYAIAIQMTCEYLVTRNVKDFTHFTHLKVVTPKAILEVLLEDL